MKATLIGIINPSVIYRMERIVRIIQDGVIIILLIP